MALNNINLGTAANNGTGEDIRSGGGKINANFAFLDSNKTDKGNYSGTAGDLKTYVDTMLQGLKWKDSVLVATTANIALTGEQTIDGVLTATSRVLVKEQTTKTENGIYLTGAGAWTRTTDADADTELTSATVSIEQGTTLAGDIFTCNTSPITLGTTDIEFVSVSRGTVVTDHNALSGKQGGTSGEYNHLTNAELNKVQALPASSEAAFTKNSAFNLPFGTTAGTVAQGDDSRILNGQAAFDALPSKETPAGAQAKADAKVEDVITDGVLDKAPSQNAVFDALAGKADTAAVVNSVTGSAVDNTDPNNPIVNIPASGADIRLSNVAADLTTTEKNTFKTKAGIISKSVSVTTSLLFDNILGVFVANRNQTGIENFTLAAGNNIAGTVAYLLFTSNGTSIINFSSDFDFLYGIENGKTIPAGIYEMYFLYKANGKVSVNVPNGIAGTPPTASEFIVWKDFVNTYQSGNDLIKNVGAGRGYNASAISTKTIASSENKKVQWEIYDVPIQFGVTVGLNATQSGSSYTDIDFCLVCSQGNASIFENGTQKVASVITGYVIGDLFSVGVENNVVKYYYNGSVVYTSLLTPAFPLFVDCSVYGESAVLRNAKITAI